MTSPLKALLEQLQRDFRHGEVELPTLPELTFRIRKSLYDDKSNLDTISRLIQLDPSLSTRLIQMANSASYRGAETISDCRGAITKLGLGVTRNVVTSLTLKNAWQRQRSAEINQLVKSAWQRSCRVGAIAHVLASLNIGIRPDQAMLGGMLHNIGTLPLVGYLERHPHALSAEELHHLAQHYQGALGTLLLKFWSFDSAYIDIPSKSSHLDYTNPQEGVDLSELILIARLHSRINDANREQSLRQLEQIPAYQKISLSRLGSGATLELLEEAQLEIDQLIKNLQ
ncbi:HDOD domain-containing protein [Ectothiorhodospiraceae bacterium BW-2]|nr:HDOD domain-containing protein [Ectothiorhodospiraceae bacterium BW-2]